jgi:hypothetical protein
MLNVEQSPAARALIERNPYFEVRQIGRWPLVPQVRRLMNIISGEVMNAAPLGYIGGSYAAALAGANWQPGDIDVFAVSVNAAIKIRYALIDDGYEWKLSTAIADTFSKLRWTDVQVIAPHPDWSVFPDDIVNAFDINVCRAIVLDAETVVCDREVGSNIGRILGVNSPLKSLQRVIKYQRRGIHFAEHELLKIMQAWAALPDSKRAAEVQRHAPVTQMPPMPQPEDADEHFYGWTADDDWWEGE